MFDAKGAYCTHNFRGHSGVAHLCWFHPRKDSFLLFSAGQDTNIRKWDLKKKACVAVLEGHFSVPTSFALANPSTLVSAGRDKLLHIWDLKTDLLVKSIPTYEEIEGIISVPNPKYQRQHLSHIANTWKGKQAWKHIPSHPLSRVAWSHEAVGPSYR